jgi:hypothetical protein
MYILEVNTPNKLLVHRGRSVRTPAKFTITEKEIKTFEVMLHQVGAEEYSIRSKEKVDIKISHHAKSIPAIEFEEEVVIEEILDDESETKSVLEKLVKNAKKGKK